MLLVSARFPADGSHYHFVTKDDMLKMVEDNCFVEHAHVHGNIYGTSRAAVDAVSRQGRVCILDIDVQGANSVAKNAPELGAYFLFVLPPSLAELERRLRGRGTEDEAAVSKRLGNARGELEESKSELWDARIRNTDLDAAYAELKEAVLKNCIA